MSKDTMSFQEKLRANNAAIAESKAPTMKAGEHKEALLQDLETSVKHLDALRKGGSNNLMIDMTFADFANERWGYAVDEKSGNPNGLYEALGINPGRQTVESLMTMPEFDSAHRWLVPEIFREAIRLGLRKNPIYNNLIVADEPVSQETVNMPYINMSDATPHKRAEGETIKRGTVSFDQRDVKIAEVGVGIEVTDKVMRYVNINIVNLFLQDVGVRLGTALDVLAIDTLLNGDDDSGSMSAPEIGVETTSSFDYTDILRSWIRMSRLGRPVAGMLSGEEEALEVLQLPEFKALAGKDTLQNINLATPVPDSQQYWIHGRMPQDKLMLIDPASAMLKLTAQALTVENERIVQRKMSGSYATITTGFANLFRDARLLVDKGTAFAGFPSYMDVDAAENVPFKS